MLFIEEKDVQAIIFALQNELSSLHIVHKKYSESSKISQRIKQDIAKYERILKIFIQYETNNDNTY